MRTTIELRDDYRAQLLELAALRGEKGFSRIVEQALESYFEGLSSRSQEVEDAVGVIGSLEADKADRLEKEVQRIRRSWR